MIFIKIQPIKIPPLFFPSTSKKHKVFGLDPLTAQVSALNSVKWQNLEKNLKLGKETGYRVVTGVNIASTKM